MSKSKPLSKPLSQNRLWIFISVLLAIILVIYVILYPPGRKSGSDTTTLASVNGISISKGNLYDALLATGGQQTMATLINNELIRQAAEKQGVVITDADVEKEMESVRQNFGTDEEFQQALTMYGMSLDSLKKEMATQAQLRKLLMPQVKITDADIKKYYDDNLETLKTPEKVKASHIAVATKAEAETILTELKNGADFAAKAKEKSTDTATKDKGGELEPFAKADKEEAISNAVFALKNGELSGVVEAKDGFHIYKLTERHAAITPTLDEKKDEIREKLTTEQIATLSKTWMEQQKSSAKIVNSLTPVS
ncbi:peptidylprolyl isomerase [Cohnella silvisoli]|uniref:Peptidyl-prolyl cis-trans isomerase n=1 Tax=Cohnella silvisoli TaxID=2873699 RepID=A0ABV1KY11_9BACL|nr:peptidyl-prolyl cis-trans isomerase [Cohnella silvisoli]MCD9021826.1 peptidyl-prolyl cis-trans isomerase [Cohnella silvisoli]